MSEEFTAVLLVGGRSRRMGRDKAFLEVGDPPEALWRRQLRVLSELQPSQVILSHNSEQKFPEVNGVEMVEDSEEDRGPLGGLVTCLKRATCERVLVLAVDLPFVETEFLRSLLSAGGGVVLNDEAVGRFEAVTAVYTRGCLRIAERRIGKGELVMQGFIGECVADGELAVEPLSEEDRSMLRNWNRPGDVEREV